jgi:hypothetical protein
VKYGYPGVPAAREETGTAPLEDVEADDDELVPLARKEFADMLAHGDTPSIRTLRGTYSIGQQRAQARSCPAGWCNGSSVGSG